MKHLLFFITICVQVFSNQLDTDILVKIDEMPELICGNVDPITGKLIYLQSDVVTRSIEPLVMHRLYATTQNLKNNCGWKFIPHLFLKTNSHDHDDQAYIHAYDLSGNVIKYKKIADEGNQVWLFKPDIEKYQPTYNNASSNVLSARTNLKNSSIELSLSETTVNKQKSIKYYKATVKLSDGSERVYRSIKNTKNKYDQKFYLSCETKSNGNKIYYIYDDHGRLSNFYSTSPTGKKYSEIKVDRIKKNKTAYLSNDKQFAIYKFHNKFKNSRPKSRYLKTILTDKLVTETIDYIEKDEEFSPIAFDFRLSRKDRKLVVDYYSKGQNILPSGEIVTIKSEYDPLCQRVASIKHPVGENGEIESTYYFKYILPKEDQKFFITKVFDMKGNETRFFYDKKCRINQISFRNNENKVFSKTLFYWKDVNLSLIVKKDFIKEKYNAREFEYDENGNVLKETLFGNLSGQNTNMIEIEDGIITNKQDLESYVKIFQYSKENLPIQKTEDNGLTLNYTYKDGTNLITSKVISDKNKIIKRHFFEYNEDNILIKKIEDDGKSFNSKDFSGINIRKVFKIIPKKDSPAINLPEAIEEYYLDVETNQEKFLSRKFFYYSDRNLLIQEDIFDSEKNFKYSINYKYDKKGNLLEKINPKRQASSYEYNNLNQLTQLKDARSRTTKYFTYDKNDRIIKKEEKASNGESRVFSYEYNSKNQKILETDYFGNSTTYKYDSFNNLLEKEQFDYLNSHNNLSRILYKFEYDGFCNQTTKIDSNGEETTTEYNYYRRPTKIIYPDGTFEIFVYNLDGTLKESIDQAGILTKYNYDVLGRVLTKIIQDKKDQQIVEKKYNGFAIESFIDAAKNITTYKYDGAGRKISEIFQNRRKDFKYDSLGRLFKTIYENANNTLVEISEKDLLNQEIEKRKEDLFGRILFQEKIIYDECGNKSQHISYIDNKRCVSEFYYDDYKRLIKDINPLKIENKYIFNQSKVFKNLEKITIDAKGTQTICQYNANNKILNKILKNSFGQIISEDKYFYDLSNNLIEQITKVYSNGEFVRESKILWKYDNMNKLIQLVEKNDTNEDKKTSYSYTKKSLISQTIKPNGVIITNDYDAFGRMISQKSSDNSINYSYDYNLYGELIKSTDLITGKSTFRKLDSSGNVLRETFANTISVSFNYNNFNKITKLSLPDRSQVEKVYDSQNLQKVIRKDYSGNILYEHNYKKYDLSGNSLIETLGNNKDEIRYHYDQLGRLNKINSKYLQHEVLEYDPLGQVKKASKNNKISKFSYDELGQLLSESGSFDKTYSYDSLYNRLKKDDDEYEVNSLNQITKTTSSYYEYDKNGNPIYKKDSNKESYYKYDALDRLIEIFIPEKTKLVFEYDSLHRRTSKIIFNWKNNTWVRKNTYFFLYQNQNEIGIMNEHGVITEFRVLGDDEYAEIGSAISHEFFGKAFIPIHDIYQNVSSLISLDTDKIVESYDYSAFGEEIILDSNNNQISSSKIKNYWRFSSKRVDEETDLVFYGRRYYDPEIGRWLTPDPEGYTDNMNLYSFLLNDPLLKIDLYGLWSYDTPSYSKEDYLYQSKYSTHFDTREFYGYEPQVIDLNRPALPNGGEIMFVNGINNSPADGMKSAKMLSDYAGGKNVKLIYNPTYGIIGDFIEAEANLDFKYTSKVSKILVEEIRSFCKRDKENQILLYCHSQGAIHVRNALIYLNDEEKARINIVAIAPAAFISRDLCPHVTHVTANGDPVPKIDQRNRHRAANVIQLEPKSKGINHSFDNPIYQPLMERSIDAYINSPKGQII